MGNTVWKKRSISIWSSNKTYCLKTIHLCKSTMGTSSSFYPEKPQTWQPQQGKYVNTTVNQSSFNQRIRDLESENQDLTQRLTNAESSYRLRITKLEKENNELLLRLSSIAGARIVDGNPNITDLSNENRPSKLAEQFSELYDNEWTDACGVLTADGSRTTEEACYLLLKVVCVTTTLCQEKSERDLAQMRAIVQTFCGVEDVEIIRQLKGQRKKTHRTQVKALRKELTSRLKSVLGKKDRRSDPMKLYVRKSLEIGWLMAIQDPPVHMDTTIDAHGHPFDSRLYRPFTKSGEFIDYIVWPVVRLVEEGSLLSKGIAQGLNGLQQASHIPNGVPSTSDAYDEEGDMQDNYEDIGNKCVEESEQDRDISSSSIYQQGSMMNKFQEWSISRLIQQ